MSIDEWELLRQTSRTFFLSIRQLPGIAGEAMCLAYLLLRVSDYLEDNEMMPPDYKVTLLKLWDQIIAGQVSANELKLQLGAYLDGTPDSVAALHAGEILDKVSQLPKALQTPIRTHVRDTTCGMARWVERGPNIPAEEDMDDYMHEVAGRVGYLSTQIFAWYSRAIQSRLNILMPLARETGLALQTVNIIRGLRKDYERGWIYVPESFFKELNMKPSDLFKPGFEEKALLIIDRLSDKADRHLKFAMTYICLLPGWLPRLRLACIWPMLFAVRTLALSRHNVNILLNEVKMSRTEVTKIVRDTTLFGWSNQWLTWYFHHLQIP